MYVQVVLRELSGFVVGTTLVKDVWRCAELMPGAQCVMTSGILLMLLWCANNLASPDTVSLSHACIVECGKMTFGPNQFI